MPTTTQRMMAIGVFLAPSAGTRPVLADYDPTLQAVEWSCVAGSGLWSATFVSDLGAQNRRVHDTGVTIGGNRQIEIWAIDTTQDPTESSFQVQLLFWGELLANSIQLGPGETETLYASMQPYHFGKPIMGQVVSNLGAVKTVNIPLEFNPMIDGKICENRFTPDDHTDDYDYFIDPESVRTPKAIEYQEGDVSDWSLDGAIESLLRLHNGDETFVDIPLHSEIETAFTGAPEMRNILCEVGHYLPYYLDQLCQRLGYNWVVDVRELDAGYTHEGESRPAIRFFKQQTGTVKTIAMQAIGETMDLEQTGTSQLALTADLGAIRNVIEGFGALIEREVTVPLFKTWLKTADGSEEHDKPHNPIGRRFSANEAGDWTDCRADPQEDPPLPPTEPAIFGSDWIPKRRVFENCLTLRDGQRRPVFVEYRVVTDEEEEPAWKPVPDEWGYVVSHVELGIWFTGQREEDSNSGGIPEEVLKEGFECRATGTIRGDTRPQYKTVASMYSPNTNNIQETLDLSDRYFDRARLATGSYASVLSGTADTADDLAAMTAYIDDLQPLADLADMNATVTLIGIRPSHLVDDSIRVGDIIEQLDGRNISFNRSGSPVGARYLQVVGITWHNSDTNQSTVLTLSPHGVA